MKTFRLPRGARISRWDVPKGRSFSFWQRISPPQLFVGSFALLVLLGAAGLQWLPGLYTGQKLTWLDALFTSTSAVCVTGLIVVDTATFFTPLGQAYILLLIQLGGLGMIAFTSLIILALGGRLSLRQEALSTTTLEGAAKIDTRRLVFDVVRFTLILEGAGALLLYLLWIPRFGFVGALGPAVFHSVSAFCNAGFSVFSDSLMGFQDGPFTQLVIMLLIIAGGLGFLTLEELWLYYQSVRRKHYFRISLHSRLVLATTAVLIVGGWICFCFFEWSAPAFDRMGPGGKLLNGLFLSVTSRTAGFNTIDYARATDSTNFLTIILMMIGGSPGSTAGGIKTTTFALIGLLAWSRFRGEEITHVASRSLREETTDRAIGLFVVAFGVVTLGIFLLTATERTEQHFLERMFEAVSAFNTVGLSMGLTPDLSYLGKWTTIALMFLGRVGPLTLAAALAMRRLDLGRFRYAYEEVAVG
jgi:trk system potassium uptake protein TrkH